jgi:hypothetical protein
MPNVYNNFTHGRGQKNVQGLVVKTERKRLLARPSSRWEDGVRMDLGEIGWGCGMDSIGSR